MYYKLLLFAFALSVISCTEDASSQWKKATIKTPKNGSTVRFEENLNLAWKSNPQDLDSITVYLGDEKLFSSQEITPTIKIPSCPIGTKLLTVNLFAKGQKQSVKKVQLKVLSNREEQFGSYIVNNTYPHDNTAYTQGLEFFDNELYEGTGINGQSELRKVKLETGEVINRSELDKTFFGEGITILNNKIYQLTWQKRVCFVYDLNTFELIKQFNYPQNMEGWGLTHYKGYLLMSDGTEKIHFINPNDFSLVRTLHVYNYRGQAVTNINELEIWNGKILANIYTTDLIVQINPETGELEKVYDMKGLLKKEDADENTDVLNGIAYNPSNNKLYVTGKNWSKLFEVTLQ